MGEQIIRPRSDLMLRCASDIDDLCADIKKLGITFFSHTRVFDNGSRIDLNNDAAMTEEFYYGEAEMYRQYVPEINPKALGNGIMLLDHLEDNDCFKFLRDDYNIAHMMVKIDRRDAYCDVWNFGTHRNNENISKLYLAHLEVLTLFTLYYQDRCRKLIKECEQDPIIITSPAPTRADDFQKETALHKEVLMTLRNKTQRYYLNGLHEGEYLTKTEMEYCHWISEGKTSVEISMITNRSRRTIEKHIENIRGKFSCYNKGQLIKFIKEFGVY